MNYYATLPSFLGHFITVVSMAMLFIAIYVRITPHKELALIRDGNIAVAIQMVLTFLGYAISQATVVANSINLLDVVLWGVISLLVQIATFRVISGVFKDIEDRLVSGCIASGIFVGGMSLGVGILQASCMVM